MAEAFRRSRYLCGWRIIPPVITCFRRFLGAQGASELPPQTPAADARRHAYAAWRGLDVRLRMSEDGASGVCWGGSLAKGGWEKRGGEPDVVIGLFVNRYAFGRPV